MYLRHSTTCLSSITLNYVFIWNWVCLEMLLGFYFNWFLFSLVFCFWKVAEFQVNASQSDITTKPNRSSLLFLVKRINRLGFVHFPLSFFPLYFFAIPHFVYQLLLFLPLDHYIFSSSLKAHLSWNEMKVPFHSLNRHLFTMWNA